MTTRNNLVTGLIAGAAVGTVAGLLFAPRPGKQTRHLVAARTGDLRKKAGDYAGSLRHRSGKGESAQAVGESSNGQVGATG